MCGTKQCNYINILIPIFYNITDRMFTAFLLNNGIIILKTINFSQYVACLSK